MKTACVDFDGVLATYTGWRGPEHLGDPLPGCQQFLEALKAQGYTVVILTTRDADAVGRWLETHSLAHLVKSTTNVKVPATVYVDDRAVLFTGDYDAVLKATAGFKTWWEELREKGGDRSGPE